LNTRTFAFLVAFLAAVIYGVTFTIAKNVMPIYIKPYGFIVLRVIGATLLFWLSSFFIKREKIALKDYAIIFFAAIFGIAINMLAFFKGLDYTTPINASVIMVVTPILVLILSAIILKEKITNRKVIGVFIGLIGAIVLIAYGQGLHLDNSNIELGNLLVFLNAASYSLYLIIVKKLTEKYHPITFAKWLYLFGFFLVLPFGYHDLTMVEWHSLPTDIIYKIGFVVVFATFFTYLFNLLAIRKLKPTTVSVFIYLQPVIATIYALFMKSDTLNDVKIIAAIFIFTGVYIVSKPATNLSST